MFEKVEYICRRLDGDYAILVTTKDGEEIENTVARALLPPELMEGDRVVWEDLSYRIEN